MSRRLAIGQTKRDTWPAGKVALHVQPGTVLQTYNSLLVRLLPPLSHLSFYFHPCPINRCLKKEVSKSHHFCVGSQPMMPLHLDLIKTFVQRTKLSNHITKSMLHLLISWCIWVHLRHFISGQSLQTDTYFICSKHFIWYYESVIHTRETTAMSTPSLSNKLLPLAHIYSLVLRHATAYSTQMKYETGYRSGSHRKV